MCMYAEIQKFCNIFIVANSQKYKVMLHRRWDAITNNLFYCHAYYLASARYCRLILLLLALGSLVLKVPMLLILMMVTCKKQAQWHVCCLLLNSQVTITLLIRMRMHSPTLEHWWECCIPYYNLLGRCMIHEILWVSRYYMPLDWIYSHRASMQDWSSRIVRTQTYSILHESLLNMLF